ncbi:MAG: HlyD family efflux transporter periplasmic adaptor subunit [Enterobacter hormaechei]
MKNRISEIERNLSSRGSSTMAMLAPSDGYVVAINFPPGRAITQNSEVVVVIRKNTAATMEGYLYVPATGVGRVAKGDKVKLRFDSWPVDKYGSVEATLSDFYEVNIDAHSALIPLQEGQNYYLAKVRVLLVFDPDKKKRMLMSGMTVNADIVIDHKPLINLLLRRWKGCASGTSIDRFHRSSPLAHILNSTLGLFSFSYQPEDSP